MANFLRFAFFSGFIMMLSVSCKKDPIQYEFTGVVKESVALANLPDASVKVLQKVYNGTVASSIFSLAGSATTNSNGMYQIIFDREKVFEFKLEIEKSGYFDFEKIISSADISTENQNVFNEVLEPKSWVQFHLENIGGLSTDELTMIYYNFREDCEGCTTNDYYYYEGVVDSIFTFTTTGGMYANYSRKNPGSSVFIKDSVYATPFDTIQIYISY